MCLISELSYSQKINQIQKVDTVFKEVDSLKGNITEVNYHSDFLNEDRVVSIYEPVNFNQNFNYGVLFVTDGILKSIAPKIEYLIDSNRIDPIIIVSINNRSKQPVDTIFKNNVIDFRALEFFKKPMLLSSTYELTKDLLINPIITDRYNRFSLFISEEVIPDIKSKYPLAQNEKKWSIGGFSNGGAFVYGFTSERNHFGNAIVMSPAGFGMDFSYDFSKTEATYHIAAGFQEEGFLKESVNYLQEMDDLKITYKHYTYNSGHDWNMWLTFYLTTIEEIYRKE
jgi:enterochelin esterase-like enzyme